MRSRRRALVLLAALVLAVVAIVLTRGGDQGGSEEVTHAQLVTRANAICGRLARDNGGLESPPRPYDFQSADFFAAVHDNVTKAKEALDELDPPGDDSAALARLVDLYGEFEIALDKIEAAASVSQDQEVALVLDEIAATAREAAESERELGVCPGDTSVLASVATELRRTRPNPLFETGPLEP
jgi:hypothetical protein